MRNIDTVMTTVAYDEEHLEQLRRAFEPARFIHLDRKDSDGIASALETADVAVLSSDLDERYLKAPKLKWIHCDHAGLNKSAYPEIFERGLIVTSSAGRSAPALAEHAIFFMLALSYNFPEFYKAQTSHIWGIAGQDDLRGLYGRTIGIVGMGHTGEELAVRAKAFGMRVLAYRRRAAAPAACVDELYCADNGDTLDALLKESDFVVLALSLSDKTYRLIGKHELGLMKPSAYIINMARGAIIDEEALIKALKENRIAGAGLDTVENEPLKPESPLWDAPHTLITPHTTPQVPDRMGRSIEIISENVIRYRSGQPLLNLLTPEDVYTHR